MFNFFYYIRRKKFPRALAWLMAGLLVLGPLAGQAQTPTGMVPGQLQLLGVNLAGAEFGDPLTVGKEYTDYTYPTHDELDYYASLKLNVIRLPISWIRVQPTQAGPIDDHQLAIIDDLVSYAATKGLKLVIDNHNYAYRGGNLVGSAAVPNSALADFWSRMATHYVNSPNVIFGLMNEPHDQSATLWASAAQAAIDAIRATGATQEILVPGSYWTGAHSWTTSDNAAVVGKITDSGHNMAFELHQYLDSDNSGTHNTVVSATIGPERLAAATAWAQATGNRLFLGEFGAATDAASLVALENEIAYLQQHSDVWQGGTYWAGGPWWGNYDFSSEPLNGEDKPQAKLLAKYAPTTKHAPTTDPTDPTTPPATLRPADNPSGTVAGLSYSYYEVSGLNTLPDFSTLTPVASGLVSSFDLSPRKRDEDFAFRYSGYVSVPADGSYTFYTSSDDGSRLYIGSQLVVDNDGLHGAQERSGTIGLKAGWHAITVTFFDRAADRALSVSYAGPSLSKQVISAVALSSVPAPASAPAPTAGLVSGGVYRLTARHSGKVLDVAGNSSASGAQVLQYGWNGGTNQQWVVTLQSDGAYTLTHQGTNQNLNVTGNGSGDGNAVTQYAADDTDAQRWLITPTDNGYYKLIHKNTTKCLDVPGSSPADGVAVIQWEYKGSNNQQWQLVRLDNAAAATAKTAARAATASTSAAVASSAAPAASDPTAPLSAYPNPSHGPATLAFAAARAQPVTVYVHDAQARLVALLTVLVQAGRTDFALPTTLGPGTYYLRTTIDGQKQHFTLKVE